MTVAAMNRLLKIGQVMGSVPVSESTIYRMVRAENFPRSIKLAPGTNLRSERKISAWIVRNLRQREDDDLI